MKQQKLKYMCLTGVFTAVIFIFTAYLHIPSHTGYTHVGDAFVYLAACLLPLPYAAFAGAAGAFLADALTGFALWAPASIIIKAAATIFFTAKANRVMTMRNALALLPASVLCIGGYYGYEALITGNTIAPLAGLWGYLTQCVLSSVLFLILATVSDKLNLRSRFMNGGDHR